MYSTLPKSKHLFSFVLTITVCISFHACVSVSVSLCVPVTTRLCFPWVDVQDYHSLHYKVLHFLNFRRHRSLHIYYKATKTASCSSNLPQPSRTIGAPRLAHNPHFLFLAAPLCTPHASSRYSFLSLDSAYNLFSVMLVSSTYTPTLFLDRILAKSSFSWALFMCDSYLKLGCCVDIRRLASEKRRSSLVAIISVLFSLSQPACLLFLPCPSCRIHTASNSKPPRTKVFALPCYLNLSCCHSVVLLWPICHIKNKWIVYLVSSRERYSMMLRNKQCNW